MGRPWFPTEETHAELAANVVWDTDSLAWVRMVQPGEVTPTSLTAHQGDQGAAPWLVSMAPWGDLVSGCTAAMTGTGNVEVIAAQGAGVKLYITHILVTNSHATVGTVVEIKNDTTVVYRGYAAALGGGFAVTLPVPLVLTANKALQAANVTNGSNTYVCASGWAGA